MLLRKSYIYIYDKHIYFNFMSHIKPAQKVQFPDQQHPHTWKLVRNVESHLYYVELLDHISTLTSSPEVLQVHTQV